MMKTTRRQREHLKSQLIETERLLAMVGDHPLMSPSLAYRRMEIEEELAALPVGLSLESGDARCVLTHEGAEAAYGRVSETITQEKEVD